QVPPRWPVFSTRQVRAPVRAAAMAAIEPAVPPPTTTTSKVFLFSCDITFTQILLKSLGRALAGIAVAAAARLDAREPVARRQHEAALARDRAIVDERAPRRAGAAAGDAFRGIVGAIAHDVDRNRAAGVVAHRDPL